jgi:hypothetical protein
MKEITPEQEKKVREYFNLVGYIKIHSLDYQARVIMPKLVEMNISKAYGRDKFTVNCAVNHLSGEGEDKELSEAFLLAILDMLGKEA